MVNKEHICPFGLKAKDLLQRKGFAVADHHLERRTRQDNFKAEHGVQTTPQNFIGGERIGGYDDLRRHLGLSVKDKTATTYKPVVAIFAMAACMAWATSWVTICWHNEWFDTPISIRLRKVWLVF
jgi:glutaredoxin